MIIGEPCPRLHPCRSLLSLTRWTGSSYRIRSCSAQACKTCSAGWWIGVSVRVVLGQTAVDGKTSEINRFAPLIETLTGIDLAGVVITADALHTQREHVAELHARGAH
jgi:hypothetical protein